MRRPEICVLEKEDWKEDKEKIYVPKFLWGGYPHILFGLKLSPAFWIQFNLSKLDYCKAYFSISILRKFFQEFFFLNNFQKKFPKNSNIFSPKIFFLIKKSLPRNFFRGSSLALEEEIKSHTVFRAQKRQ